MLRYAVFLIFIVVGFILSRHRRIYPIVATTADAVVATSAPVVQHWWVNAAYEIFRMKTSSYREAFILNIMLFVPMGYLLRTKRWWSSLLICSAVSLTIEILQQLTGFGMFDWNDWIANTIGSLLGACIDWI